MMVQSLPSTLALKHSSSDVLASCVLLYYDKRGWQTPIEFPQSFIDLHLTNRADTKSPFLSITGWLNRESFQEWVWGLLLLKHGVTMNNMVSGFIFAQI